MHVEQTFGTQWFETEWKVLVEETHHLRQTRNNSSNNSSQLVLWKNTTVYLVEAFLALLVCVIITWIFRWMGILGPTQSIFGAFRAGLWDEEL
jgi:hypothetical protein